jgi:hypothetical protein
MPAIFLPDPAYLAPLPLPCPSPFAALPAPTGYKALAIKAEEPPEEDYGPLDVAHPDPQSLPADHPEWIAHTLRIHVRRPTPGQIKRAQQLTEAAIAYGRALSEITGPYRETHLALDCLRQSVAWGIAGILTNE